LLSDFGYWYINEKGVKHLEQDKQKEEIYKRKVLTVSYVVIGLVRDSQIFCHLDFLIVVTIMGRKIQGPNQSWSAAPKYVVFQRNTWVLFNNIYLT